MRLFEIAGTKFTDDLANLLKVMQGRADSKQTTSVISWPALNHMLLSYGHGEVNADMLTKVKDQVDPSDTLIQDITDNGVVLKTQMSTPEEPAAPEAQASARSVDQMASRAASRELK